jgi:hypothetical protein
VEKTAKALEHLRQARRQYRDALLSAAFS